jgi:hypothetical protein
MESTAFAELTSSLESEFKLRDVGLARAFIGIDISRPEVDSFALTHETYLQVMAKRYHLENAKSVDSPMVAGLHLGQELHDVKKLDAQGRTKYLSLLGAVAHVTRHSRPDASFAKVSLTRRAHAPNHTDMGALRRLAKYLVSTAALSVLRFDPNPAQDLPLFAVCDASLMNIEPHKKSALGVIIYFGTSIVYYSCKSSKTAIDSSAAAETQAMVQATRELLAIRDQLAELGVTVQEPLGVYSDNQAAILSVVHNKATRGNRHTLARTIELREAVHAEQVQLHYIPSAVNTADLLTKSLSVSDFIAHRDALTTPSRFLDVAKVLK